MASELEDISREELDVHWSVDHCRKLAKKLGRWEPLLPHIGLDERDRIAIKEDQSSSYEEQRIASISKWRKLYGSTATYLKLAEGLVKIGHLDLVEELCKIYKSKPAEPYQQQDLSDDEKEKLIKRIAKEPTHLKQHRDWKDDDITQKTMSVSSVILAIAWILYVLCLVLSSTHLWMVTIFLYGIIIPMVHTYYIGGALLKKANGDVWKNVVIDCWGDLSVEYIGSL